MVTHDQSPQPRTGWWSRLWAVLRLRCPRCLHGGLFRGFLTMRAECPECGLKFGREDGYYTGAMIVSYALSVPVLGAIFALLYVTFTPQWTLIAVWFASLPVFVPFALIIFRYSRAIWLHIDWKLDPPTDVNHG